MAGSDDDVLVPSGLGYQTKVTARFSARFLPAPMTPEERKALREAFDRAEADLHRAHARPEPADMHERGLACDDIECEGCYPCSG